MNERYIVFVDVDETLIRCKSMVAFMEYFLGRDPFASRFAAEEKRKEYRALQAIHSPTADRVLLNRRYYELFKGISPEELQRATRNWFLEVMDRGDFFVPSTYDELIEHKARGAEVVLVSGSFFEVLRPICSRIGASDLLCTELEVVDGAYTGKLVQQVIGDGKWEVICRYLGARQDVRMDDCYAYGDHVTDVCFMEKVGHPVIVSDCPGMLELAEQRRWRVLSSRV